ncbi:TPA: hypothetical protein DCE37_06725 [Candidatus Latescibacteria bacterium]|nr:hypothetical protein [Candidatus Latescibacterota bacterium]
MMRIWIDMDNAPHVPLFRPVIRELEGRGHEVSVTLRDYGYTADLARQSGISYHAVGSHPGANLVRKVASLGCRALRLASWARQQDFDLALSHGSRGLVLAARMISLPAVTMFDYEHVSSGLFQRFSSLLLPKALETVFDGPNLSFYPGFKEEIYLGDFEPSANLHSDLDIPPNRTVVLIRPPATTAHYHDSRSEATLKAVLDRISRSEQAFGIIVPRTAVQGAAVSKILENPLNFHILECAVNGLDLIWASDLVVGGGGTMNREAALLGVPVYSIFSGPEGTIDRELADSGLLHVIRHPEDVTAINVEDRPRPDHEANRERVRIRSRELVSHVADVVVRAASR